MSKLSLVDDNPKVHAVLEGHKKAVTSISFNPNNQQFASSSEDNSIMVWTKWANSSQSGPSYRFSGHTDTVTCIDYSPNCKLLASSSKDCTVRLWVPTILGQSHEFKPHLSPVHTVHFSPDGLKLLTGSSDKCVKLWDVHTRQFIASYVGHNHWVTCAKFFPLSDMIASCSEDRTVRIWDSVSGEIIHTFRGHNNGIPTQLALHANNNTIAVAMSSGSVRIYDIRKKELQQHYSVHSHTTCVDWHPKANYLLSGGLDNKLRIIDIMEGRPLYTLNEKAEVSTCKFSSDGDYFASGGKDRGIILWKTNFIQSQVAHKFSDPAENKIKEANVTTSRSSI